MFHDREIADPIVAQQVFTAVPKGELKADLIRRLKFSQQDMEHRLHPWMSHETRMSIQDLENESSQKRRRTLEPNASISGQNPRDKKSFRGPRDDIEDVDSFQTKSGKEKGIGGKGGGVGC